MVGGSGAGFGAVSVDAKAATSKAAAAKKAGTGKKPGASSTAAAKKLAGGGAKRKGAIAHKGLAEAETSPPAAAALARQSA